MEHVGTTWLDKALDEKVRVIASDELTVTVEMLSGNASEPYTISAGDFYNSHELIE